MKNVLLIILLLSTFQAFSQSKYEKSMQKAFELLESKETDQAVAYFERIAQVEKENWIPLYHLANTLIFHSFDVKDLDERLSILEKAKTTIAAAHARSADNSEIYTLEGLLYTGYVVLDPGTYGMTYSQKVLALHEKAIALNPNNLRAQVNKIQYQMNTARFFGQNLDGFCQSLEELIPKFDSEVQEVPFAPSGGKERAVQILASCNE